MNIRIIAGASVAFAMAISVPAFSESGHGAGASYVVPGGQRGQMKYAKDLYEHGMYVKAREVFSSFDNDPVAKGYALLCDIKMKSVGYETKLMKYVESYPYSGLVPQIRYAHALNLFDAQDYSESAAEFSYIDEKGLYKDQIAEYTFKKAYSELESGSEDSALEGFLKVTEMPKNDFQAPSAYSAASIYYARENFNEAIKWFSKSQRDQRFARESAYYIMECRFMNKDYKYVTDNASKLFNSVPVERRPRLARIISESYLVQGDVDSAKSYYDRIGTATEVTSDKDYFYAGSLLYAMRDYKGAIENYTKITDKSDSLGQIADYQLAYSYVQTKNKVQALQAFKNASSLGYNSDIQEDAYFNYAKLAFDINRDPSVFTAYMKAYPEKAKDDQIYSYMALASLYNRDYASAVEAYDKVDVLDDDMQRNYMKANYLRANQLIAAGSYRKAIPCLKAAAYYSDKRTPFNQLSRYWLAECYYRDNDFTQSAEIFKTLYNNSALNGKPEGDILPYDVAYCYFKRDDYPASQEWFDNYLQSGNRKYRRDALVRKGDAYFMGKDYQNAISSYLTAIDENTFGDDLYPYYQAGLSYSLLDKQKDEVKLLAAVKSAKPETPYYCESMYELGRAYMGINDSKNAESVFKTLASEGRDTTYQARALIGLGMLAANDSKFDEAISYYKQVVDKMPSSEYSSDALRAIESIYQTKQEPEQYYAYLKTLDGELTSEENQESMFFNAAEQIFLSENYQKALSSLQAYMKEYPHGDNVVLAEFYMAESYKYLGNKEQACDWYKKVIDGGESSYIESASLSYAKLSYGLEKYADAYSGYQSLSANARIESNKHTALVGMMNSAYYGKDYEKAIAGADKVLADKASDRRDLHHAKYVLAKSYLSTSQRDEAMALMKELSASPSSDEGAEAAYLVIQDAYDNALFNDVETLVYKFADSAGGQTYWLAKAFILLGDSFAERGEMKQAKATFESIRDGYTSDGNDDVLDNVEMRLKKIEERGE